MKTLFYIFIMAIVSGGAVSSSALAAASPQSLPSGDSGAEIFVQTSHSSPVAGIAVPPDSRFLASASHDGTLKLWDIASGRLIYTYREHRSLVNAVVFAMDGNLMVTAVAEPESALHVIDRATGRRVRQLIGHTRGVQDVAVMPGGRRVLSVSDGAEVMIWDVETGDAVASWSVKLAGGLRSVAVFPDGKHAVIGSYRGEIVLISLDDGRVIREYAKQEKTIERIIAHPDGHSFITAVGGVTGSIAGGGAVIEWAVDASQPKRRFDGPSGTGTIWSVALSADARSLIAGGDDSVLSAFNASAPNNAVWIWNMETGELQARWQMSEKVAPGQGIRAVAATPAGQVVYASASNNALAIRLLAGEEGATGLTGREFGNRRLAVSPDGESVWTTSSLNTYSRIPGRVSQWTNPESPSMPRMRVVGTYRVMRWDLRTGTREDVAESHEREINLLAFSGGRGPFSLSGPGLASSAITYIESIAGADEKVMRPQIPGVELADMSGPAALSPSGRLLAVTYRGKYGRKELKELPMGTESKHFVVILEQSNEGYVLRHVLPDTNAVTALSFTKDEGALVASVCEVAKTSCFGEWTRLRRADVATGKWVARSDSTARNISSVRLSPDGSQILTTGPRAVVWEVRSLSPVRELVDVDGRVAVSAAWSPDQKRIVVATADWRIQVWDTEKIMAQQSSAAEAVPRGRVGIQMGSVTQALAARSGLGKPQGVLVTSVEKGGPADIAGLKAGDVILSFDGQSMNSIDDVQRVVSDTRPGSHAVIGVWRNASVRELDITVAERVVSRPPVLVPPSAVVRTISGFDGYTNDLSFSPDGRSLFAVGSDGALRVWDVETGTLRVTMVEFDDGEWITVTPEGYFAGSPNADRQLNVRMGERVYGMDQFYDVFYRPDIVQRKLRGERIDDLVSLTIADALQRPPPQVGVSLVPSAAENGFARISIRARDAGGGVGNVRVFHNGKLIFSDEEAQKLPSGHMKQIRPSEQNARGVRALLAANSRRLGASGKSSVDREITLRLAPGQNRVWATGFNADNSVQGRPAAIELPQRPEVQPRVFVLAIGVNQYRASKDIPRLTYAVKDAQMFSAELRSRMSKLFPQQEIEVTLLADHRASIGAVEKQLERLTQKMQPGDVFVWFIASHGMLDGNGVYNVVLHDANLDSPGAGVLPNSKVLFWLKRLPALNQLLVLDTCHAGGLEDVVRGVYEARIGVLARSMGLHILASASATQEAVDGYKGNGLFTHALLRSIADPASDTNGDKKLTVTEMGRFSRDLTKRVSHQLRMQQTPMLFHFGRDLTVSTFQ